MTMHILRGIYGINANPKSKSNARQRSAKQAHDDWLRARGLHPEQIAKRQAKAAKVKQTVVTKAEVDAQLEDAPF